MSESRFRREQSHKTEQAKEKIKIPDGHDMKSEGLHYEEAATEEDIHTIEIPEAHAMSLEELAETMGIIPEGEPDDRSLYLADAVSDDLMLRIKTLSREQPPLKVFDEVLGQKHFREYTSGTPLNDVAHGCRSMAEEFASARRMERPIVCVQTDTLPVPISVSRLGSDSGEFLRTLTNSDASLARELVMSTIDAAIARDPNLQTITVDEAEETAHFNLRTFLSFRYWGWKNRSQGGNEGSFNPGGPPADAAAGGGLRVRVFTEKPGLRIHAAPAYFIDEWVFFGHPTSPAEGYVLPGRYIFAADGLTYAQPEMDPTIFAIPPSFKIKLTRF